MDPNIDNVFYLEAPTMKILYDQIKKWQDVYKKRLLSINIQKDDDKFCCIGMTNPTEVIICDGFGADKASVEWGNLCTK